MLDIGFRPDIEKILRRCPESRQTLLLSATVPPPVAKLATRYMRDPEILDFSTGEIAVETIEQFYFTVDPTRKFDLLERLLEREQPRQVIVFCRTKRGTDKIYERLIRRRGRGGATTADSGRTLAGRLKRGRYAHRLHYAQDGTHHGGAPTRTAQRGDTFRVGYPSNVSPSPPPAGQPPPRQPQPHEQHTHTLPPVLVSTTHQ